jgi:tRNA (guanine-N7-)-methyltransferase
VRKSKRLPLTDLQPYLIDLPAGEERLDLAPLFGNQNPIEVEVGFGKGLFLVTAAQAQPETNFLGIEIERAYQLFTATRVAKRKLVNVRLVKADARTFFHDYLADHSVQAVHVYFPDPWWKRRHRKRRVFTPEFARECGRVLRRGGRLHVATDVDEYFEEIGRLVAEVAALRPLPRMDWKELSADADYMTNFERKSRQQGRPICRALYERA